MKEFDKYEKRGAYHYPWYDENTFHYKDRIDKILSYLTYTGSVLDVGSGDGCVSYHLCKQGHEVVGIDTNKLSIKLANESKLIRSFNATFNETSIYHINLDIKYDYVICTDVLEHLVAPQEALKIMHDVCKDFCIITTPDGSKVKASQYDNQLWGIKGITKLFKDYEYEYSILDDTFFIKLIKA